MTTRTTTIPETGSALDHTELVVTHREDVADRIVAFELQRADGAPLPEWGPGAHIDVRMPNGLERQYSLCGDPADRGRCRIAVLLERDGTGGSAFMHESVHVGDSVLVTGPRNHFRLREAAGYHFIAGGIGVTAILPMVASADARGVPWTLSYLGRSRSSMAFIDELARYGDHVTVLAADEVPRALISDLVAGVAEGELVYACGPERLLRDLEEIMTDEAGHRLEVERFAPKDPGVLTEQGTTFAVALAQSGITVDVPPGTSILSAVEEAGVDAAYSCREGTCGTCETRILSGIADHRDSILSPDEQEANETVMICVSRSKTPLLELDL